LNATTRVSQAKHGLWHYYHELGAGIVAGSRADALPEYLSAVGGGCRKCLLLVIESAGLGIGGRGQAFRHPCRFVLYVGIVAAARHNRSNGGHCEQSIYCFH